MKKYILLSIIILLSYTSIKSQDYRYIPDANFRSYLVSIGCPFDLSGDSLDISSSAVTSATVIDINTSFLRNLEGVQYFTSLLTLTCYVDSLRSLPSLPNSLQRLDCFRNLLDSLPALPSSLTYLDCSSNLLTSLPTLPSTLRTLRCGFNSISSLPTLPDSLKDLDCISNHISILPALPDSLRILSCGNNHLSYLPTLPDSLLVLSCGLNLLTSLPSLPISLFNLSCGNNAISNLPSLPDRLASLNCGINPIRSIPTLPSTLIYLECYNDSLTSLPNLPDNIQSIDCRYNNISCLPKLPRSLTIIDYENTSITCIPNIISGAAYYPTLGTHPLCNPYIQSCPSYTSAYGNIYIDNNNNCIVDSSELKIKNISITLKKDTNIIQQVLSYYNGFYAFNNIINGTYTINIDTTNIPFNVTCPISGFDTILIDSLNLYNSDRHFALQCKTGFDIGTTGLINTGRIRPATPATFDLHAGDMASLYGVHCTNIAGKISMDYSGPLHYTGVGIGTLLPDSILPNRLVWNIADFSLLDFNDDIKPNFYVDSSAISGDLVCFTTEVTPSIGDRVPSNNNFSQCFNVRAAYDPNYKNISPTGSVTPSQDWLYYTIHFQNLGNSYAENIYIWDTIDPNLNLNTIQVMGASHDQFMNVFNYNRSVRFNFMNIMLQDSATNEPESKGWVQYRIKPKAGLVEGMQINNTASILFDLNAPVVTNTVNTRICNTPSYISQTYTIIEGQSINIGTHTYNTSGTYTDILSNMNGCDSVVTTTIQVISGIANEAPLRIIMYPNPANHQVLIQLEGHPSEPLSIIDMYGRKIFESETITNKYQINTESWSNGTYIIQCGSKRGKLVVSH